MPGPSYRSAVDSSEWTERTPIAHFFKGATYCYLEIDLHTATSFTNISANSMKTGSLHRGNFYQPLRNLPQGNTLISTRSEDPSRMPGRTCGLTGAGTQLLAFLTNVLVKNREVSFALPNCPMMLLSKLPFTRNKNVAGLGFGEIT